MKRILPMITLTLSAVALLLVSAGPLLAMANKPPVVLPQGALNAAQIESAFSGKTAVAVNEEKPEKDGKLFFFAKDKVLYAVDNGWLTQGDWAVRDDGRLCTDFPAQDRDCRMILKEQGVLRQYVVKLDGNHRYETTYTEFHDGNQLARLSEQPILPLGSMSREEVLELFSGKTVESVTAVKGRVSRTYYDPNGTVEQLRKGDRRYGKWRVTKNGRICLEMENSVEKCRIMVREGDQVKKYIVKKNGMHQHSVSYRKFTEGKDF
jgi:hypothetical protein